MCCLWFVLPHFGPCPNYHAALGYNFIKSLSPLNHAEDGCAVHVFTLWYSQPSCKFMMLHLFFPLIFLPCVVELALWLLGA